MFRPETVAIECFGNGSPARDDMGMASRGDDDNVGWWVRSEGGHGSVLVDRAGAGRHARHGDRQRGGVVPVPG